MSEKELKKTDTNSRAFKYDKNRVVLNCPICPPGKYCNGGSPKKHGTQKRKKNNIDRSTIRKK